MDKKFLNNPILAAIGLIMLSGGSGSAITAHLSGRPDSNTLVIQKIEQRLDRIENDIFTELKAIRQKLHAIDIRLTRLEVKK